jgi:hypothetical protein
MKFLISEEEKSRILSMHQNATSRQYLSEQAIYNWEGGGRKIKYKVQGNKYYTSRDEGKTWTELTKQEDIDWVKTNAIKPENLDKSAKTATAPGPAVREGQTFPITDPSGNQLLTVLLRGNSTNTVASKFTGTPVKATISSIKFGTSGGDYVLLDLRISATNERSAGIVNTTGNINYTVKCNGAYSAVITKDLDMLQSDLYVMSNVLQSKPNDQIGRVAQGKYFSMIFSSANLTKMNKNLADSVVSYFCDGLGSLRSTWKAQIGK